MNRDQQSDLGSETEMVNQHVEMVWMMETMEQQEIDQQVNDDQMDYCMQHQNSIVWIDSIDKNLLNDHELDYFMEEEIPVACMI